MSDLFSNNNNNVIVVVSANGLAHGRDVLAAPAALSSSGVLYTICIITACFIKRLIY